MKHFIGILASLSLLLMGCSEAHVLTNGQEIGGSAAPQLAGYAGEVIDPPVWIEDFTLPASSGSPMRFHAQDGQWRILFIGYLHCPDFCPLTLVEYREVKALMGNQGDDVLFIYVSVDGDRDTPELLRRYLNNFDPEFLGLAGDDVTLASMQEDFGFYYRRNISSGTRGTYTVEHSTWTYLIDPDGYLRARFTYDISPQAIAEAITRWMAVWPV